MSFRGSDAIAARALCCHGGTMPLQVRQRDAWDVFRDGETFGLEFCLEICIGCFSNSTRLFAFFWQMPWLSWCFSFVRVLQHEPCAVMRSPFVREHTSAAVKRALRYLTNGRGAEGEKCQYQLHGAFERVFSLLKSFCSLVNLVWLWYSLRKVSKHKLLANGSIVIAWWYLWQMLTGLLACTGGGSFVCDDILRRPKTWKSLGFAPSPERSQCHS